MKGTGAGYEAKEDIGRGKGRSGMIFGFFSE